MTKSQTLDAAKAAWEAGRDDLQAATDYANRILAAGLLGQLTAPEATVALEAIKEHFGKDLDPAFRAAAERISQMVGAEVPAEVIAEAAHTVASAGREVATVEVLHLGGGHSALKVHMRAQPDDGIGQPIGHA